MLAARHLRDLSPTKKLTHTVSDQCHLPPTPGASGSASTSASYRHVLWFALVVNVAMFALEIGAGVASGSVSLLADAMDFFGDAANYGLSLWALGLAAVWTSRVALSKAVFMLGFGVFLIARTAWAAWVGTPPEAMTMGFVGTLALVANLGVAFALYRYRHGDANMQSVWLCTRNDALGNIAVMLAALGVFGTHTGWPDWIVAVIMAGLAIGSGASVLGLARAELKANGRAEHAHGHDCTKDDDHATDPSHRAKA
jgi:Co/Zn/Cd efflux system component